MIRRFLISSIVIGSLVLAACGDDDGGSSDTTAAGGEPVSLQALSDALLTTDDLGEGWVENQRDMFTTREPTNPSIDPSLWCEESMGTALVDLAGQEGADVELQFGEFPTNFMVRQQAWSNDDVDAYFTEVKNAVSECDEKTWTDSGGNSYTMGPTESPTVGDDSVSWSVSIELANGEEMTSIALQTVAQFGDVIMVLQGGAPKVPDATAPNYTVILRAAADKVAGSLG